MTPRTLTATSNFYQGNKSANTQDYKRLHRECLKYNAEITWNHDISGLDIRVKCPTGFVWVSCGESTIHHSAERLTADKEYISEAVDEVLQYMSSGTRAATLDYDSSQEFHDYGSHGEDCECPHCESFDPEFQELDFAC